MTFNKQGEPRLTDFRSFMHGLLFGIALGVSITLTFTL